MKLRIWGLSIASLAMALSMVSSQNLNSHQRLVFRNQFKLPEEVIEYYCARDASGFVWTGLLEVERRAYTLWKEVPEVDSFFVARDYQIGKTRYLDSKSTRAAVDVTYNIIAISDGNGSKMPTPLTPKSVTFTLKKDSGTWKIETPTAQEIASVVLESKFPFEKFK